MGVPVAVPLPGSQCGAGNGRWIAWTAHDDEFSPRDRSVASGRGDCRTRATICHLRELSQTVDALAAQIAELVASAAPQRLAEPGLAPPTAGKLIREIAGAQRFTTDAKLARARAIDPISAKSVKTNRHRLDRGDNRQITTALHRVAPPAAEP